MKQPNICAKKLRLCLTLKTLFFIQRFQGKTVKGAGSRAVGPYLLYKLGEMLANIGNML
jgi:hypothetical protein